MAISSLLPQEYMDSVQKRLERSRQMQTVLRAFEARDRNLLEDNLWRVSFWSCASVLVMLCVALTQVNCCSFLLLVTHMVGADKIVTSSPSGLHCA